MEESAWYLQDSQQPYQEVPSGQAQESKDILGTLRKEKFTQIHRYYLMSRPRIGFLASRRLLQVQSEISYEKFQQSRLKRVCGQSIFLLHLCK